MRVCCCELNLTYDALQGSRAGVKTHHTRSPADVKQMYPAGSARDGCGESWVLREPPSRSSTHRLDDLQHSHRSLGALPRTRA
jgi:hypothetical protein